MSRIFRVNFCGKLNFMTRHNIVLAQKSLRISNKRHFFDSKHEMLL